MTNMAGSYQADAAEFYRATAEAGTTTMTGVMMKVVSLIFPNYQLFNITDAAMQGQVIPLAAVVDLTGLTLFYVVLYTLLSWFVFSDKEF